MSHTIASIRKDYMRHSLNESDVAASPIRQFDTWWAEAVKSEIDEINAMTLATATNDGLPDARIVLLKGYDEHGFVFFTNYHSNKGQQMEENPRACLVFFWKELERQVRITGVIEKVSEAESNEYFHSRPHSSRIGAWASPQSQVIESRSILEHKEKELSQTFEGKEIPRPLHWGGYRLKPFSMEFWQGRPSRLHDRIHYTLEENGWKIERLAP
ncbi:pyridoxamine 5'-phosphate oxidase [Flavihumibacter stibioxidans]|uniref:Pyridoxine/pyridoxamine 5'-phosphate oxidase n=1 Tax=Flavihumibacter stibioxidans TaxID=1834163 RepID=A0ABR7MA87_9BACT|nr:pyridoxamine 5'-phosphate oxidase [Flavihumibacter stibioxidans]MBC6491744.1 pyridoxamine 5'-phosphate oxidase [Flavihumibacter stibioxidans]